MSTEPLVAAHSTALRGGASVDIAARAWARVEAVLIRAGDWLNPILVKETRQAVKSRQFVITFLLVLVSCWIATFVGVAWIGPAIYYAAAGNSLLFIYFIILSFPLAIVVPFSAFRSLAAEREDNTYDVLSITTLTPRQIISGKLGSSIAQMAIYFSAVTPCLAFTYLLRGVDIPTIVLVLTYTFLGSLGLSMIGLFLATLSKQRYSQIFISVVLVAALIGVFIIGLTVTAALLSSGYAFVSWEGFWIVCLACFTVFATSFVLVFFAAAGMITFASENRSTPLRLAMLAQQAAWIGWLGFAWISGPHNDLEEMVMVMFSFAIVYWYVMGMFLTSERPQMSARTKRRLPKSFLARAFLTWLNPGAASGYIFVIANLTSLIVMALIGLVVNQMFGITTVRAGRFDQALYLMFVGWGYLVIYLGIGRMLLSALRRVASVPMVGGVLIHVMLVIAGTAIPWSIQMMSPHLRMQDYSLLQITNPFWTLSFLASNGLPREASLILVVVFAAAICVLVLNLPGVVHELRQLRIALPARVAADELALHPLPAAQPTNPWDERD